MNVPKPNIDELSNRMYSSRALVPIPLFYVVLYTLRRIQKLHQNAFDENTLNSEYYKRTRKRRLIRNYIGFIVSFGLLLLNIYLVDYRDYL